MAARSLLLNVSNQAASVDPYWLNMEIVEDKKQDGMTVAEAADIIDATYNIKACEEQPENDIWNQDADNENRDIWTDTETGTPLDGDEVEARKRFAVSLAGYTENCDNSLLSIPELISYQVNIKIFRSHRDELYKLQMANGVAGSPRRCTGRVVHTLEVEKATSITLDNPIIDNPVMAWQGINGGPITIIGNTLLWDEQTTGTIRAEFDTEWDELTITVTGEYDDSSLVTGTLSSTLGTGWYSGNETGEEINDYQNVQCSVLAFYHYQYDELILNRPEEDESTTETDKLNLCHFVMTTVDSDVEPESDPAARCLQHVNETIICQCGSAPDQELDSHYEEVACPPGVREGSTLQGSQERTTYKDCGYRDEANDPAVYENKCCIEWPFDFAMPLCKKITTRFTGTGKKDFNELGYPEGTNFITVSPVDGRCGEHLTEQVMHAQPCCDVVPTIYWDFDNSAELLSPSSRGTVFVTGGKSPYTWSVRGSGFAFNSAGTVRDAVTTEPYITIYTSAAACGTAVVYVTDNCTSVNGAVRSTQGKWNEHCYVARVESSPSGVKSRRRPVVLNSNGCGICYEDFIYASAECMRVQANSYRLVSGTWAQYGCYITANNYIEKSSFDSSLAQLTVPVITGHPTTIGYTPEGAVNSCSSTGEVCAWIC